MENKTFLDKNNQEVHYLSYEINNSKCSVVISHGMAEHPQRYEDLASYLNSYGINVYAIYHIGHGEYAKKLGHMEKNDFSLCIEHLSNLVDIVKKKNNHEVFLLAHSMGSFMGQLYITLNHNIDGLILSGSTKASLIMKLGSYVSSIVYSFSKEKDKPSPFMDKLAFGAYNKKYDVVKTKFDWLNQDEKEVKKYIDDPYCGWVGSVGFFYNLTHGIKEMGKKKNLKNIDKNLPILIHGGEKDPVSNFKKGLIALYKQYKNLGMDDVDLRIYENDRHEIYNEINKKEVYEKTLEFIDHCLIKKEKELAHIM